MTNGESPMQWDHDQPFCIERTVQNEHLDGLNHTNNVQYLHWLEQAAWSHSESLGLGLVDYQRLGYAMVASRHEIDYLAPSHLGDTLQIATWIIERSRLTTVRTYQIVRPHDQRCIVRARTIWACVDFSTGRAKRMPAEFYEIYTPFRELSNDQPSERRRD